MILKIGFLFILIFSFENAKADSFYTKETICRDMHKTLHGKDPGTKMAALSSKYFKPIPGASIDAKAQIAFYESIKNAGVASGEQYCLENLDKGLKALNLAFAPITGGQNDVVYTPEMKEKISLLAEKSTENKTLTQAKSEKAESENYCSDQPPIECKNEYIIHFEEGKELVKIAQYVPVSPLREFSEINCDCLRGKVKERLDSETKVMTRAAREVDEINELIIKAAGKKIINDFASLHEDINYYETTIATKILAKGMTAADDKLLCKDFKSFKKAIDAACLKTGMTKEKDERINEILGVYGNPFESGDAGFIEGFKNLVKDIDAPYSTTQNFKKNKLYTREMYNDARWSMHEKGQSEIIAINDVVTKIINTKSLNERISKMLEIDPLLTPLAAIENLLSDNTYEKQVMNFIATIKNAKSKELINQWINVHTAKNSNLNKNSLFDTALTMSPGLKQVLQDQKLYAKASKGVIDSKSIIEVVEGNQLLSTHFADRCKVLEENLADAICTKPEEIKNKITKIDLMNIIDSQNKLEQNKSEAMKLLICNTNRHQVSPGSAFDHLLVDDPHRSFMTSDFSNKKENNNSSFFTNLASITANDDKFAKEMNKISEASANQRISNATLISSKAYRDSSDYKPFNNDDFLKEIKKDIGRAHV